MKLVIKILTLITLGATFMTFSANSGCDVMTYDLLTDDYGYQQDVQVTTVSEIPSTQDELVVWGSGDNIRLSFNNLIFPAQIDWDTGLYNFAPDPDGTITGDIILCSTSINHGQMDGDCFRYGHTCHFSYDYDSQSSANGADAFYLVGTTCSEAGDIGPFLVTVDNPICGQDSFPACPPETLPPN